MGMHYDPQTFEECEQPFQFHPQFLGLPILLLEFTKHILKAKVRGVGIWRRQKLRGHLHVVSRCVIQAPPLVQLLADTDQPQTLMWEIWIEVLPPTFSLTPP